MDEEGTHVVLVARLCHPPDLGLRLGEPLRVEVEVHLEHARRVEVPACALDCGGELGRWTRRGLVGCQDRIVSAWRTRCVKRTTHTENLESQVCAF